MSSSSENKKQIPVFVAKHTLDQIAKHNIYVTIVMKVSVSSLAGRLLEVVAYEILHHIGSKFCLISITAW